MSCLTHILNNSKSFLCRSRFSCTMRRLCLIGNESSLNSDGCKLLYFVNKRNSRCFLRNTYPNLVMKRYIFNIEFEPRESHIFSPLCLNSLKEALYPNSCDPFIIEINKCCSLQEVLNFLNENPIEIRYQHACQTLLVLWCIRKEFLDNYVDHLEKNDLSIDLEKMKSEFTKKIVSQNEFQRVLDIISHDVSSLSANELSLCLYFLRKFELPFSNSTIIDLVRVAEEKMKTNIEDWNIRTLTKYTTALKCKESLQLINYMKPVVPLILKHLDETQTEPAFRDVTICLNNIHVLLTKNTLENHKKKLHDLIDAGIITSSNHDTILTIIYFYNLLHWSDINIKETNFLMLLAKPSISSMSSNQVVYLHNVFQIHMTSASILPEFKKKITSILDTIKDDKRIMTYTKIPELLYCQICMTPRQNGSYLNDFIMDVIKLKIVTAYNSVYKTLQLLKLSDSKIYDLFWKNIINHVMSMDDSEEELLKVSVKYMYYVTNYNEFNRNEYFENMMTQELLKLLDKYCGYVPWKVSRIASFIIAFKSHEIRADDYENIVKKLIDIIPKMKPLEMLILSKGFQIYWKLSNSRKTKSSIYNINTVLNNRTNQILSENNLSLLDLCFLYKSYLYRNMNYQSELFYKFLNNFSNRDIELTPKIIKDIIYSFFVSRTFIPKVLDKTIDYVAEVNEDCSPEIMHKVLVYSYQSGYTPKNEEFLKCSIDILDRNMDMVSGLLILESCIALSYYGHIPKHLIEYIFCLDFMERLDREVEVCFRKNKFSDKLREQMMILNRIICLDFPHYEIPWFHKKYIEGIISLTGNYTNQFHEDVFNTLLYIIKRKEMIRTSVFTPYGYKVNFLLDLDENGNPIRSNQLEKKNVAHRIAIMLLNINHFVKSYESVIGEDGSEIVSCNDVKKGHAHLQSRHLELLGYTVIEIPIAFWNSMHMMEPRAKINFLKNKIWPSNGRKEAVN